jgi:hypothetical protein
MDSNLAPRSVPRTKERTSHQGAHRLGGVYSSVECVHRKAGYFVILPGYLRAGASPLPSWTELLRGSYADFRPLSVRWRTDRPGKKP